MAREFIAPGNIFTGAGALDMAEDKLKASWVKSTDRYRQCNGRTLETVQK